MNVLLTMNRKVIPNSMIVPIRLLPKGWVEHPLLKALASPMLNHNICCNTIRIYNSGYVRYSALSLWSLSLYCILKATMSGWNVYLLELNQHFVLFWQCRILFPLIKKYWIKFFSNLICKFYNAFSWNNITTDEM